MQAQSKSIFASKSFWLNILTIALAIVSFTDPKILHVDAATLLWISGVLNIGVRFLTTGSVTLMGGGTPPPPPVSGA